MDHDRVGCRGGLELGGTVPHQRVDDAVQGGEALRVREDDSTEPRAVESPVGRQDVPPERLHDGREPGRAGLDDLAGDPVGVDQYGPVRDEQPRHLALAAPIPPVSPTVSMAAAYALGPGRRLRGVALAFGEEPLELPAQLVRRRQVHGFGDQAASGLRAGECVVLVLKALDQGDQFLVAVADLALDLGLGPLGGVAQPVGDTGQDEPGGARDGLQTR